jgi:hypothetical protein
VAARNAKFMAGTDAINRRVKVECMPLCKSEYFILFPNRCGKCRTCFTSLSFETLRLSLDVLCHLFYSNYEIKEHLDTEEAYCLRTDGLL